MHGASQAPPSGDGAMRGLGGRTIACSLLVVGLAIAYASRAGSGTTAVLGSAAPLVDALLSVGAIIHERGWVLAAAVRLPAAVLIVGWLAVASRSPHTATRSRRLGAVALGYVAQSYLLDEHTAAGLALYASAMALFVWRVPRDVEVGAGESGRRQLVAVAGGVAVFVFMALYHIDVYPDVYLDEVAYLRAARMQLGELERGAVLPPPFPRVYPLERFQAQFVPLGAQASGLAVLGSGLLQIRLVSVAGGAIALLVAAATFWRRLGPTPTTWMVLLTAAAPLFLAYSRSALYIGISMLHSVLCFALLARLAVRRELWTAIALGLVLGLSLFCYQLSWFVPVLVVLAIAVIPGLRDRAALRRLFIAGLVAVSISIPGAVLLRDGLAKVVAHSFDYRALWSPRAGAGVESAVESALLESDVPVESPDAQGLDAWLEPQGLRQTPGASDRGHAFALILGGRDALTPAISRLEAHSWRLVGGSMVPDDLWTRFSRMLGQLFRDRGLESNGRMIDGPIINPLLAPLLLLGLAEAVRRRDDAFVRLLLVWAVAGALLPAVAGQPLPRRAVLMIPFAQGLMVLSIQAVAAATARTDGRVGTVARATAWCLAAAVLLTGAHLYFHRWDERVRGGVVDPAAIVDVNRARSEPRLSKQWLTKVVKSIPADEVVLTPKLVSAYTHYVEDEAGRGPDPQRARPIVRVPRRLTRELVTSQSCAHRPPLTWIARDDEAHRRVFDVLGRDFHVVEEARGAFRLYRIDARRAGGCADAATP